MAIERDVVGKPETYQGRTIEARFCGPDLLCYVDGLEVGNFYLTVEAAKAAGRRYVDQVLDEQVKARQKR